MERRIRFSDFKELDEIFKNHPKAKGNKTKTAKVWCKNNKVEYNDSYRRQASKVLFKGIREDNFSKPTHNAKILLFDLETSYISAYVFGLYNQNINPDNIIEDWKLLCFSAKWLFSKDIISFKLTEQELKDRDDSRIVKELWKLMDEADIVIAHNAERFDNKKAKAKFFEHDLGLPSSFKTIDTLRHARTLGLTSKRLDYISKFKNADGKLETSKGMWRDVMDGKYDKLVEMSLYCDEDVNVLEGVYLDLLPYIKPHPNLGLFIVDDVESCPSCGSQNIKWKGSDYLTSVNRYSSFRCTDCNSVGRSRKPLKLMRENLTIS